jgi:hypothetical protein
MKYFLIPALFSLLIIVQIQSFGQAQTASKTTLDFFLDCRDCDFNFVRQELSFVSFVRDPKLADVHIFSSESHAGSGGRKYYLNFIGLQDFEGLNMDYEYFSEPSETDDETRKGLLKIIKAGVVQYYSKTDFFERINFELEEVDNTDAIELIDDPWKLWVLRIGAGASFEKEERQNEFSLETDFRLEKVTNDWKALLDGEHEIDRENYYDNGEKFENHQNRTNVEAEYIKSLTSKWSAGLFGDYSAITYMNIKHSYELAAAAEYNIFPWDISNRKIFTLEYKIGVKRYNYLEETIYDKMEETVFYESLGLDLRLVQPWGDIEFGMEGRHYFHDFSMNRFLMELDFSVRLTKQLSVYGRIETQSIHDQLYLPKGDASLEDVLLKRRKLATTYEIDGGFGLRYTFGSIYNNVVNERL